MLLFPIYIPLIELRKAESFKQYERLLKKHFSLDY